MNPQDPLDTGHETNAGAAPLAFLFNADTIPTSPYDRPPKTTLFGAVLGWDRRGEVAFYLRSGDLLVHHLSVRPTQAQTYVNHRNRRVKSLTLSDDPDTRPTLIWELCRSAMEGWFTFDPDRLPLTIGRANVFVLCLSDLPSQLRDVTDHELGRHDYYLGGLQVDPGNPLHRILFVGYLPLRALYVRRSLLLVGGLFDEDRYDLAKAEDWWSKLPFEEVGWLEEVNDRPIELDIKPYEISPRGQDSLRVLNERTSRTHMEAVIEAVHDTDPTEQAPLQLFSDLPETRVLVARMQEKLTRYVLNPGHPEGGPKATRFAELLGLSVEHWRYLARQLIAGLHSAQLQRVRATKYGVVQYHADIAVLGLNGRVKTVRTAWKASGRSGPELVTAFIPSPSDVLTGDVRTLAKLVLPHPLTAKDQWRRLYEIAHKTGEEAATRTVPTPMFVSTPGVTGAQAVPEGAFGFASVNVPDARRGFARWLRDNGLAHPGHPTGVDISAPYHAMDRGVAYATAFAEVLELNGIDCTISSHPD